MSTKVLELTQVKAPGSGRVSRWYVSPGAPVGKAAQLGVFVNGTGVKPIQAPAAGTVARLLIREGTHVDAGAILAEIVPDEPQPSPPPKPYPYEGRNERTPQRRTQRRNGTNKEAPDTTSNGETELPNPQQPGKPQPEKTSKPDRGKGNGDGRRSNGLHIEELTVKPTLPAPVPRKQERRPKIVTRTTRPTDRQSQRFDDLTTELQSLGYDFARSELERCMFDLFLSLDVAEVARLANRNREQEQRGRYGIGFV